MEEKYLIRRKKGQLPQVILKDTKDNIIKKIIELDLCDYHDSYFYERGKFENLGINDSSFYDYYVIEDTIPFDMKQWDEIREKLTSYFGVCPCQRKIKSIIDNLVSIKEKCLANNFDFTGAEWLLLALMDKYSNTIMHGINCEYPIINENDEFWVWIDEVKNNPNLIDK